VREQTDLAYLAPDRPQRNEGTATNLLRAHEGQSRKRTCERTHVVRGRGRRGGRWGRCAGRWRVVGSRRGPMKAANPALRLAVMRSRAGLRHLPDDPRTFSCPYSETWRALHLVPCSTSVRRGRNGLNSVKITRAAPSAPLFDGRPMRVRWGSSGPIGPHRTADPVGFCARCEPMRPDARF